jgi:hypothetical protein
MFDSSFESFLASETAASLKWLDDHVPFTAVTVDEALDLILARRHLKPVAQRLAEYEAWVDGEIAAAIAADAKKTWLRRRSEQQINAIRRCIGRLTTQDVSDQLAMCLREWGWRHTDIRAVDPLMFMAGFFTEVHEKTAFESLSTALDERAIGKREQALRDVLCAQDQPIITQMRYIAGRGLDTIDQQALIARLGSVCSKGVDLADYQTPPDSWLVACAKVSDNDYPLISSLAKMYQWADPELLVNHLSALLIQGQHNQGAWIAKLTELQPAPWKRWVWDASWFVPPKVPVSLAPDDARIVMCGLEANEFIRFDRFQAEAVWVKPCQQWDADEGCRVIDKDEVTWQRHINLELNPIMRVSLETVRRTLQTFTREFFFDSPQDWLRSLPKWDGTPRFSALLEAMHAPTTDLHARMLWWWVGSLVKRIQQPGAKADYTLLLVGEQGMRKSLIFERLGLGKWTMTLKLAELTRGNQDKLARKLQGKLIVNIDEWGALRKQDRETVKAFITDIRDEFDVKWQRATERADRRFIIGATSNVTEILSDPTGDRRYLPFVISQQLTDTDLATIDAIWPMVVAEARHRLDAGIQYWPSPSEEKEVRELQQGGEGNQREGGFREVNATEAHIHENLDRFFADGLDAFTAWESYSNQTKPVMITENYQKFLTDKSLDHSIREAIRSWTGPKGEKVTSGTAQVKRKDGSYSRHYRFRAPEKSSPHITLDGPLQRAGRPEPHNDPDQFRTN